LDGISGRSKKDIKSYILLYLKSNDDENFERGGVNSSVKYEAKDIKEKKNCKRGIEVNGGRW
jgi:hypothetical protein